MKKILAPLICTVSLIVSGGLATIFTMQLTGAVDVFADEVAIEFRNFDNTYLWSTRIPVGDRAVYEGDTPTHPSSELYDFYFSNWDKPIDNVVRDTVFYAQFERRPKQCKVVFQNYNNKKLYEDSVPKGGVAVYIGVVPTRESDEGYAYKFKGWDKPLEDIQEDTVFTAEYDELAVDFEIIFKNYDESTLYIDHVAKGEPAKYRGIEPVRPNTSSTVYTFKGWDRDITSINSHFTTHAVYDEEPVKYTVNFYNDDGTLLYTDYVAYQGTANYRGPTPYKEPIEKYQFKFNGWSHSIEKVSSDLNVVATYVREEREFSITFFNYDDTLLYATTAKYGMPALYGGLPPTKPDDEKYSYTFKGWDRNLSNITEETVTYAEYNKELRKFLCTFKNEDGSVLYTTKVTWGETAIYQGPTPIKPDSYLNSHRFIGWDKDLHDIEEDTVFIAQFEPYGGGGGGGGGLGEQTLVVFHDYDNTILDYSFCEDGGDAKFHGVVEESEYASTGKKPNHGGNTSYVFHSWSEQIKGIAYDEKNPTLHVYAQYEEAGHYQPPYVYEVCFHDKDGELLWRTDVWSGNTVYYYGPSMNSTPGFMGWNKDLNNVTGPLTVFPVYKK